MGLECWSFLSGSPGRRSAASRNHEKHEQLDAPKGQVFKLTCCMESRQNLRAFTWFSS